MKTLKKAGVIFLVVIMVFSIIGCKEKDDSEAGKTDVMDADPVRIQLMQPGWVNQPVPDDHAENPFKEYLDTTYNVDFQMYCTAEFESEVLVRFASANPPDIVCIWPNLLEQLYSQQVVIDDWTPYLDKMPAVVDLMTDGAKILFTTDDGKMKALARKAGVQTYVPKIRQDWLENLDMEVPETYDDLLDVARAFTFDDPNNTGEDDTHAFSSAGSGVGLGEIGNCQLMFGPDTFYIDENNNVQHPNVDGNRKKFLDFMRLIVSEGLIEPDWYIQDWEVRKVRLNKGELGIVIYPGVLVMGTEEAVGNTGETVDWYSSMNYPKATEIGGKVDAGAAYDERLITVSANAAKDEAKMDAICRLIDGVTYPNEGYFILRWGAGIDNHEHGSEFLELDNGYYFWSDSLDKEHKREIHRGLWDYGRWIAMDVTIDKVIQGGGGAKPDEKVIKNIELDDAAINFPHYEFYLGDLSHMQTQVQQTDDLQKEFEINYIMGETDDYEGFLADWRRLGGDDLLEDMERQFREYGYLK